MIELHFTEKQAMYKTLENLLIAHTGHGEIAKTPNGKPYAVRGGLHFSLSHGKRLAVIAISDKPVGVDYEEFSGRSRTAVLSRFSERERAEIISEYHFLAHWTVREAYIKLIGGTLAGYFKRLEFFGGNLYLDGKKLNLSIKTTDRGDGVVTVCTEDI